MDAPFIDLKTPRVQKQVPVGAGPITVGRNFTNLLVVDDDQASRFHCVIEKVPEGFRVRDLDSRNGTKVNGKAVKAALLKGGDVIQIGKATLTLVVPGAKKAADGSRPPSKPPTARRCAGSPSTTAARTTHASTPSGCSRRYRDCPSRRLRPS